MMQNIKITIIISLLFSLNSCKNEYNSKSFEIDRVVNKVIKNNKKCLEIFDKVFYVDSSHIEDNPYVESLVNRFVEYNKGETYERLILLRLNEEGEAYKSTLIGIQIKNNEALMTRYDYENEQPKFISKEINSFNLNNFLSSFKGEELKRDRNYNLLIIDFESNESCNCMFSGSLSRTDIEKIKDFTFFEQFK